jgi:ribonuclease P/MRP protein subunit POP5
MKSRPPTLREKKRYILVSLDPADLPPDPRQLFFAVHEASSSLFGDSTTAGINPAVIMCEGGFAIIRCRRGTEHPLTAALATVIAVNNERAALRTRAISGTIHALKRKIESLSRPPLELPPGSPTEEICIEGRVFVPVSIRGNKVNLMEKGFKNRELLFLTQEDIEEL